MVMDEDNVLQKNSGQNDMDNQNEEAPASERVFDISEDSISPATDEPPVFIPKNPVQPPSTQQPPAKIPQPVQKPPITTTSKPYIPPDAELLDKKIGTFDATPFAPAKNTSPIAQNIPKVIPTPTKIPEPPTNLPTSSTQPIINAQVQPSRTPQPVQNMQQVPVAQPVTLVQKKPAPIPLQNIPSSIDKTKVKSLQDEIAAVLPANLREKKPEQKNTSEAKTTTPIKENGRQQSTPIPPKNQVTLAKPVRTYEGDVAEVMSHKRTSTASMAIAEAKKTGGEEKIGDEEPKHNVKKLIMFFVSLLLLGGGGFVAYYFYSISPLAPVTIAPPERKVIPSIIPKDSDSVIVINNQSPIYIQGLIQNEAAKSQKPNTIKEVVLAKKNTDGGLIRIGTQEMIKMMDINNPDILTRSLSEDWMLGVRTDDNGEKSAFIVVTSTFFQNTFAGMLQWEHVMADDIRQYLFPTEVQGIGNTTSKSIQKTTNPLDSLNGILPKAATSTASTTDATTAATTTKSNGRGPGEVIVDKKSQASSTTQEKVKPLRQYVTLRGVFEDRIVKNRDVREFRTDTGMTLFLYSFIDNTHLVITKDEATLAEILTRLEKQSYIR